MSLFPKSTLENDFSKLNKLIYGFPKTGKTTLASHFYDHDNKPPLFIATEDGHKALEVHSVRVSHWDGFLQLIKYIKNNDLQIKAEHSCLIIDIVSDLDDMCTNYICKMNDVRALADLDYGKGFALAKSEFRKAMSELFNILPIVFVCHTSEKEIMWHTEKIKVQSPNLSKQCLEYVNGKVDLIMWIAPPNSQRQYPEIIMENSTTCIAGSRFPQLVGNFPFDPANVANVYTQLSDIFEKGVVNIPTTAKGANNEPTKPSH